MRTHPDYITYYTMWTRLLATGIFPLAMLAILNTKIYLALRRSKAQLRSMAIRAALPMAILGKPATPPSQLDLRIDSNWSSKQNGHAHLNGIKNGTNGSSNGNGAATPPKSPRPHMPHPMNRSVSAAVVESPRPHIKHEHLARSQSTAAATPLHVNNEPVAPPPNPTNDLSLAPILFGVVIVFVLCNTLRVFLNMYEMSVAEEIVSCEKKGVGRMPPAWIVCTVSVSHLLLMINSSVNFLVYCVAGSKFRSILYQHLSSVLKKLRPNQANQAQTQLLQPQANLMPGIETALLNPQQHLRAGLRVGGAPVLARNRLLETATNVRHPRIVEL